ncbi:hypothetical protein NIES4071_78280 [Calothrix sp. NIES-4071]|nr:hypothetical protein NIES4071_78280 [Calothrix sp. NIES-4071]BAZ62100.1 hypothetical protein NIES4105_78210 [Calothrix sp. NIES-4105]
MLHKNFKMTVLAGKLFAAIAFIITSTILSGCSTPESQKPEVPTQPQKPQSLNNQSNQQPNQQLQQSNQANNGSKDDDKDDDKDSSKEDKD